MEIPNIAQPPADYPYIVALLGSFIAIGIALAFFVGRAVLKFLANLIEKLEKRADDERARADRQAEEAVKRWELGEEAKRNRADRLSAKIDESNEQLTAYFKSESQRIDARIDSLQKEVGDIGGRTRRLESRKKQPPKEGG